MSGLKNSTNVTRDGFATENGDSQEKESPVHKSKLVPLETGDNGAYVILVPGITDRQWYLKEQYRQCQTWLSEIGLGSEHKVWVYQYDLESDNPRIFTRAGITSEALSLLDCLSQCRQDDTGDTKDQKRIVFVMLDIGGTIVKEALTIASLNPARYGSLDTYTASLVFVNCPHRAQRMEHYEDLLVELLSSNRPYHSESLRKVQSLARSVEEINGAFLDTKLLTRALIRNLVCPSIVPRIDHENAPEKETQRSELDWEEEEEKEMGTKSQDTEEGEAQRVMSTDEDQSIGRPPKDCNRPLAYYGTPSEQTYKSTVSHYELIHGLSGFEQDLLGEIRTAIADSLKEGLKMEFALLVQSQAPPAYPRGPAFSDDWSSAWAKRILGSQIYKDWSETTGLSILHIHGTSHVAEISRVLLQQLNHVEGRDKARPTNQLGEVLYFEFNRQDARFNSIHAMLSFFVSVLCSRFGHFDPVECSRTLEKCTNYRGWSTTDLFSALVDMHEWDTFGHQTLMISCFDECDESRDWFLHRLMELRACDYRRVAWIITSEDHLKVRGQPSQWTRLNLDTLTKGDPSCREGYPHSEMTALPQVLTSTDCDLLLCVQYAMRPLTVHELAMMMSLESKHRESRENYVEHVQATLNAAQPLVYMSNNEVHLKKSLLSSDVLNVIEPETAHAELARRCLSLLQDEAVQSAMKDFCCCHSALDRPLMFPPRHNLIAYAATYWFWHYRLAGEGRPYLQALEFFSHSPTRNTWFEAHNILKNPLTRLGRCYMSALPLISMLGLDDLLEEALQTGSNNSEFRADCDLALSEAARNGHVSTVRLLMKTVQLDHQALQNSISHAASYGSGGPLHELVVHASKIDGFTWPSHLLCRVAILGLNDTAQVILEAGISTNPPDSFEKRSPLHLACLYGNSKTVKILLAAHANLECRAIYGRSPLHAAVVGGIPDIITQLLDAGSDKEALDNDEWTPLQLAMSWGRTEAIELLLHAGADPDRAQDSDSTNPLAYCCRRQYWKGVHLLLNHEADINCKLSGVSPLYFAVVHGNVKVARILLEKGADPNEQPLEFSIPLMQALCLEDKSIEMVQLLLDKGARIEQEEACTTSFRTLLCRAAGMKSVEMVKFLIQRGADVNHCGQDSSYPVYAAVQYGQLDNLRVLVDAGADINCMEPVHRLRPIIVVDDNLEILQYLLDKGADINAISDYGTCLHQAVSNNQVETVKLLLKHRPRPDLGISCPVKSGDAYTALGIACSTNNPRLLRMLLEAGADRNQTSREGLRPLDICIRWGCPKAADVLLEYVVPIDYADEEGNMVLHYISNETPQTLVRKLVNAGVNLHAANKKGVTPLQKAVESENLTVARYLLFKNANPNNYSDEGQTLIHMACANNQLPMVQALVKAGADIQLADSIRSGTPLLTTLLESWDHPDMQLLRYIVEEGKVDVNRPGGFLGYPLTAACGFQHIPHTQYLIDRGADTNVEDCGGRRPIHLASAQHVTDIINILLTSKVDITVDGRPVSDRMGRTPLHFAALSGKWAMFKRVCGLYDESALILPDKAGWTPLFWALMNSSVEIEVVQHLLDHGADLWARVKGRKSEFSPLKLARYSGVSDAICGLLTPTLRVRAAEGKDTEEHWDEEFHLSRKTAETDTVCDSCRVDIRGIVYSCRRCPDYDLCFRCFMSRKDFHYSHPDDWERHGPEYVDDETDTVISSTDPDSIPESDNNYEDEDGIVSDAFEDVSSDSGSFSDDASQGGLSDEEQT